MDFKHSWIQVLKYLQEQVPLPFSLSSPCPPSSIFHQKYSSGDQTSQEL